jgi:hypothetical protein
MAIGPGASQMRGSALWGRERWCGDGCILHQFPVLLRIFVRFYRDKAGVEGSLDTGSSRSGQPDSQVDTRKPVS